MHAVAKFVNSYLRIFTAEKQEHSHTQAVPFAPTGHIAAIVGAMGILAEDKEYDKSYQRLGQTPGPLPKPEQKLLHLQNLGTICVAITSTNLSSSSFVVCLHRDTRNELSMISGGNFIAVSTWLR